MTIGVVIPALNEAAIIGEAVGRLAGVRVVVADGGSDDATAALARDAGALVIAERGGRGARMNAGAAALPDAEFLVFLHADTVLPEQWQACVTGIGAAVGAFRLAIENATPAQRFVAWAANQRSRWLGLPYGDQALFLRRSTFEALGGFRALPIMEDFDLVRRARRLGPIVIAGAAVVTSARRWRRRGTLRTTAINQLMLAGWALGVPPEQLARIYRGR